MRAARGGRRCRSTAGAWEFRIKQKYQVLDVDAAAQGQRAAGAQPRLRGEEIKLVVTGMVGAAPGTTTSSAR